jgi:Ni2+-binding GTPase involved in maturation of urease and hydrogenase
MKRINFYGAPSAGKSVLAHEVFTHYKKMGRNCDVVNGLIKNEMVAMTSYRFGRQIANLDTKDGAGLINTPVTPLAIW